MRMAFNHFMTKGLYGSKGNGLFMLMLLGRCIVAAATAVGRGTIVGCRVGLVAVSHCHPYSRRLVVVGLKTHGVGGGVRKEDFRR